MKQLKKTLLTLVVLTAVSTGAWADDAAFKVNDLKASLGDNTNISLPYEWKESAEQVTVTIAKADGTTGSLIVGSNLALSAEYKVTVSVPTGGNLSSIAFTTSPASQKNNATASNGTFSSGTWTAEGTTTTSVTFTLTSTFRLTEIAVSYTPAPAAPAAPEVTPTANKNEWTFQMPAYDVVVGVEYETALALNEVEVSQTAVPTETAYVDFIPTLGKTTITGDDATSVLFLAAENKLKNPTELPTLMKGFRAYFQLKDVSTARSFQLNLGEEATGVQFVATESQQTGQETYDLQGRRMESSIFNTQSSKLKKGVYIVNGKKTVVR